MVSINRSFVLGTCFASVTWILLLFLYENFYLKSVSNSTHLQLISEKQYEDKEEDLSALSFVKSREDQTIKDEGYKLHAFNVLISNRLSFNRKIMDTRNALCKDVIYPEELPTASIIICFYNEHFNTLLRSIYSVINRTPNKVLHEIILVDDYSSLDDLNQNLRNYLSDHFKKVKLLRTERREGLIRARIYGSRRATGDVLIFLDSHIEVNVNWIEPLLYRIKQNVTNIAVPIIDIINADTFNYTSSPLVRGGFNWGLHFKWDNLPKGTLSTSEDFIKPIKSPTMAGGLFAIDRKYFYDLGEYDAFMNIWGGENIEISFRIWMCGGRIDLIPCSRVGHVFRQRRPYGAPDGQDTMLYNSLRVAHVWMDEYKEYFLKQRAGSESMDYGDISSRITLRKELKCQNFNWYLKNVYPELVLPTDDKKDLKKKWETLERDKFQPWYSRKRNYEAHYKIRLSGTQFCIQPFKDNLAKREKLVLMTCARKKNQIWYQTDKNELVLSQLLCLQASKPSPILYKCHETGGDQEWKHKDESGTAIFNLAAGLCLGVGKAEENADVIMTICDDNKLHKWDIINL